MTHRTGAARRYPRNLVEHLGALAAERPADTALVAVSRDTELRLENPGSQRTRVLLYAGERQNIPLAWYGPFVGDSNADIVRSFERYRAGTFKRV